MSITWRGLDFLGFMVPLALVAIDVTIGGINDFVAIRISLLLAAAIV